MKLTEIIYSIQKGNDEDLLKLILELEPVIDNLSKGLNYPESKTDLVIFLIELSKSINIKKYNDDNVIKLILIRALKNKKIDLFRKNILRKRDLYELNLDITSDYLSEFESNICIENMISTLPYNQKNILLERFFKNNSDIEIANKLGVSRQSVNKTKNKALKNLKEILENEGVI